MRVGDGRCRKLAEHSKRRRAVASTMEGLLIATARKIDSSVWNDRTGNGILDARAAYDAL